MLGESAACCLDVQRRLLPVPGLVLLSKSGFRSLRTLFSFHIHNDMEPNEEIILLENKNMLLWLAREISVRNTREDDQDGSDSTLQDTGHGAYEVRASAVLLFFARLKNFC